MPNWILAFHFSEKETETVIELGDGRGRLESVNGQATQDLQLQLTPEAGLSWPGAQAKAGYSQLLALGHVWRLGLLARSLPPWGSAETTLPCLVIFIGLNHERVVLGGCQCYLIAVFRPEASGKQFRKGAPVISPQELS